MNAEFFGELVQAQEMLLQANRRAMREEDEAAFAAAAAAAEAVQALLFQAEQQGLDGDSLGHAALVEALRLDKVREECLRFEWLDRHRSSLS